MSANTKIEWADHTFNPWIGCTKVSPACDNCYAEADFDKRRHVVQWGAGQPRKRTAPSTWAQPLRWNAEAERTGIRHRVFCASLADVFDNSVPQLWRTSLFGLIYDTPHLDWLLLTKRIGNASEMLKSDPPEGVDMGALPNVWIGATICNQEEADRDIQKLLAVPAARRFLSIEPLLGRVNLHLQDEQPCTMCVRWNCELHGRPKDPPCLRRVDWIIVGGESGPNARPMHPDWARSLRNQCQDAGVPFLFKQWGEWSPGYAEHGNDLSYDTIVDAKQHEWPEGHCAFRVGKKAAGRLLDGREWNEVPASAGGTAP